MTSRRLLVLMSGTTCLTLIALHGAIALAGKLPEVTTIRVPDGGIQPQTAVDVTGRWHLIYYKGDERHGDIYYSALEYPVERDSAKPIRVNSRPASAIAVGNIRGAHLAIGKEGRVHVAWFGSDRAEPKAPGGETPMLYTRLNDAGDRFAPQRNLIHKRVGLDGGGSVAADASGNVYVVWHAFDSGPRDESNRRVWVARSADEGRTFAPEIAAFDEPTGACACCGMRAFADHEGGLYLLYRGAAQIVNRDMYLLTSSDGGRKFDGLKLDAWIVPQCVMSSAALAEGPAGVLAAWETEEQVYFARVAPGMTDLQRIAAPGTGHRRKHPVVAANDRGEVILAWTEGMGWNEGGSVHWQVFDKSGQPLESVSSSAPGVPVWSLVAVIAWPDGRFTVVY